MSPSRSDSDEVQELHREAEELRAERKRRPPRTEPTTEEGASEADTTASTEQAAPDVAEAASAIGWDENIEALAHDLQSAVDQLETAVRKRPILALLAGLGCGIVVGRLTSRR